MKKKIAVFANAWSEKTLSDALEGLQAVAKEHDYDLFVFVSHAAPGMTEVEQREEKRIYKLPDMSDFDGLIVFSATMNFNDLVEDARDRAKEAGIPSVSVGYQVDGMVSVEMSNEETMMELVEHLVTAHGVKTAEFIAGPAGNESSDLRINAWKKVFAKHNLPVDDNCIHYSDWSVRGAMDKAHEVLDKYGKDLPDAIICANDQIGMAVCGELEEAGIHVPEDVIVTGYDNTYEGQIFYPAMCTVGQDNYEAGRVALQLLLQKLEGKEVNNTVIQNHLFTNQSCGCCREGLDELRLQECKNRFYDRLKTLEFGWSNSWIADAVLSSPDPAQIKGRMMSFFVRSNVFGNGTTYILEDDKAKQNFAGKDEIVDDGGYSEKLHVMTATERHVAIDMDEMNRRELIPAYQKQENDSKLYIFMPIHFKTSPFGYVVVENWLLGISTGKIKIFIDSFNQTIEKLRQNLALGQLNAKLQELYAKDSLTGLHNRFGFNTEGVRIFNECKEAQKQMTLMFVDINRMKLINDYYGHLQGDMAIKTVAETIQRSILDNFIAIRFGGDEFLIVGQCDQEEAIKEVQSKITDGVRDTGKQMKYPFYLSVSCGYLFFTPEEGRELDIYIKQADEAMYDIKAYMHTSDKELREFVTACESARHSME